MKGVPYVISLAVLLGGIAGVIYPAFIEPAPGATALGLTQIMVGFLHPELTYVYFARVLCLGVAICTAYLLFVSHRYARTPITVVRTDVIVNLNHDYSEAHVTRTQTLRANQPNVTAYFCRITTTSENGKIPKQSITMSAFCQDTNFQDSALINGRESSGFEIIHKFGRDIPYSWFMPLIPKGQLTKSPDQMLKFVRRLVVIRHHNYCYVDELNNDPVMTFAATTYPQYNLSVTLNFVGHLPAKLEFNRVKSNGVIEINSKRNGTSASVFVDRLQNEVLRISW